ncbi:hypothetical protein Vafri_20652 [Volvox africanus]|uniref:Uncharacterized protein n=1 Tax=Volvox africanus TaxID=51714 RepID=A0A8J4FAL4_9CHLO|nr:hypothetical protein Vafri_20652 [Volvox africanus]
MGHSSSKHASPKERVTCLDFPMRLSSQASYSARPRNDTVTTPGFATGIRLSWLVESLSGSYTSTVQGVMEGIILPQVPAEYGSDSVAFGPATHVVLVHPSMPWTAFIAAILNHLCVDFKKALLAVDAPLSPRSPLASFVASPSQPTVAGSKSVDMDGWPYEQGGVDNQYHSTFLHIDFLSNAVNIATPSSTVMSQNQPQSAAMAVCNPVSGDAAERVLARMPGEPAALLVVDPAGAIFTDPRAIHAIAAAIAFLRKCTGPSDRVTPLPQQEQQHYQQQHYQQQHYQQQHYQQHRGLTRNSVAVTSTSGVAAGTAAANITTSAARPLRFQLASSFDGADWAPVIAAFGRLPGTLPDDPAAVFSVCETVLEAARQQYNCRSPLLHISASHVSICLELEYGCNFANNNLGASGMSSDGVTIGGDGPSATGGGAPGAVLPRAQRNLLPGQIETAEKLAIIKGKVEEDRSGYGEGDYGEELGGGGSDGGRDHGPESKSDIAKFARNLFSGGTVPRPAPAVPVADPEALTLVRRSRSLTESLLHVCATSARHVRMPGRSCNLLLAAGAATAAMQPVVFTGGHVAVAASSAAAPTVASTSACVPSAAGIGGAAATVAHSFRGGCAHSGVSVRIPAAMVAYSASAECLSNPNTTTVDTSSAQQASACTYQHYSSAMASGGSSTGCCPEGTSHLVTFAVEAARRYAALLEAVGLWAPASEVLEACLCATGERWGHRSSRMASLLTQLGRLQQMQGLYRTAEVTWRQALEALDSIHGPDGVPVLQCRVALAQVLAALREPEAETMMRDALASLDAALGPTAPATLTAREAVASFLAEASRWVEAEVAYQALLQAMEEAAPLSPLQHVASKLSQPSGSPMAAAPPAPAPAAAAAATSLGVVPVRQRQAGSASSPQHYAVARAPHRVASQQHLMAGMNNVSGPGRAEALNNTSTPPASAATARVAPMRSDSRSRMAWGTYPISPGFGIAAAVNAAAALDVVSTSESRSFRNGAVATAAVDSCAGNMSGTYHRSALPPLQSSNAAPLIVAPTATPTPSILPPLLAHDMDCKVTISATLTEDPLPSTVTSLGGFGSHSIGVHGNANPLAWSNTAAALADVVAAVHREYGGVNELYDGMHLAGPEGSTGADLAALAAVCPRSGACIAAVVNVRRLTDASALYDAAIAARRAVLYDAHPAMVDLQLRFARHLSAAGEHGRAEEVCRFALQQFMLAPPPYRAHRRHGAGSLDAFHHPVEVGLRQTLGAVLLAGGSLAAATAALTAAVDLADKLVAIGDLAAADMRRIEALDTLAGVLWQRAQSAQADDSGAGTATAASPPGSARLSYGMRAIECKRKALELRKAVCGERHERVMAGWVALGQMQEAGGNLAAAERAFECAADVALHRHNRLSAATKAIFRQLQRVYQAQGRTADAQVLGHMYRLKGGLLSSALPSPPPAAPTAAAQA